MADDWHNVVKQVVVILSTGRTGTKALAHYFDECYPQVTALHEPKPTRHLRVLSNRAVAKGLPGNLAEQTLRLSRVRLLNSLKTPTYIESNWYLYGFLEALKPVFGDGVKVLHVVRDVRTFIPSYLNYGTFRGLKKVATTFMPYWYLRPEQADPRTRRRWTDLSPEQRLAFHWQTVNTELDAAAEQFGSAYRFVRYEDLFAPDGSGVTPLVDWFGLPHNPSLLEKIRGEKVNASTGKGNAAWTKIDPAIRKDVLSLCGDAMRRYGYDLSAEREEGSTTDGRR